MYGHSCNQQHIPYVPSRMKYVYLQRNQITGIQDGVFDNATSLVWVMQHQNQLSSDKGFRCVLDMMNYSQLRVLRMEVNKISAKDVPA
ncbi:unnamed protein product [Coregonus sp. 'balchen']|nr:unnamed protein product [Coregonus sp. 'balchen']